MNTLEECRARIDEIDNEVVTLLNRRMEVVRRVGEIKHESNSAIYRPEREKAIIDRLTRISEEEGGLLNSQAIEAVFLEIFAVARNLELPERIAYLGPEGSFTHQAAESRFGAMSDYLSLGSIEAVFKTLEASRAKFGVVPIENSRDGVVGRNA
jgi:chorismate mutase / prephenate dehydratase